MDAVPAVIFISRDPTCEKMTGSRATYEILRTPPGANVSKSAPEGERPGQFQTMKDGRVIPAQRLPMQQAAATAKAVTDYEFDVEYPDGSRRTLLGNAIPLLDEAGSSRGAVSAFLDITERKRLEEALR